MPQRGDFREDLFHRLNVIRIHIPKLSERRDDIPRLMRYFFQKAAEELGGATTHTRKSSVDDGAFENDVEALAEVRRLVDFLPLNNSQPSPPMIAAIIQASPAMKYPLWFGLPLMDPIRERITSKKKPGRRYPTMNEVAESLIHSLPRRAPGVREAVAALVTAARGSSGGEVA